MTKKKHSSATFQDERFCNPNCKLWIAKSKDRKNARCNFCFTEIYIASKRVSVLNSDAEEKNMKSSFSKFRKCWFIGKIKTVIGNRSKVDNKGKESINKCLKLCKERTIDCEINENFLNSEIWWCLKVEDGHLSNNFSSSLSVRLHYSWEWENWNAGSFCKTSLTVCTCKCKCNYFDYDFVIFRTCYQIHFFLSIFYWLL